VKQQQQCDAAEAHTFASLIGLPLMLAQVLVEKAQSTATASTDAK